MRCDYWDAAIDSIGRIVGMESPAAADQREVGLSHNEGVIWTCETMSSPELQIALSSEGSGRTGSDLGVVWLGTWGQAKGRSELSSCTEDRGKRAASGRVGSGAGVEWAPLTGALRMRLVV